MFSFASVAYAQNLSSPISAFKVSNPNCFGAYIGFGQNLQSGDLFVDCPTAVFSGGTKFGFTVGALFEHFASEKFSFGAAIEYNSLGINASFGEIEPVELSYLQNGETINETANIQFENEVNTSIHEFAVIPYVKYSPVKFLFLRAGLSVGALLSTNLTHTKTVEQSTVRLSNGEIAAIKVTGNGELQNSEITELNTLQMHFVPAVGFNLPLSERVEFSPVFEYGIPFTGISSWGDNFKISYWRLLLELRIKFSSGEKNTNIDIN